MKISIINIFLFTIVSFLFLSCEDTTRPDLFETGSIFITSNPKGALIWLDLNFMLKSTPGTDKSLLGTHHVTLTKKGFYSSITKVFVKAGEVVTIKANLEPIEP